MYATVTEAAGQLSGDQLKSKDVKMEIEDPKKKKEDKKEAAISFSSTWKYACKIVIDQNR